MFVQTLSQRLSESYSVTLRVPPAPSPLKHVCLSVGWRAWVTRLECQRHEGRSQEAHWANHWLLVNTIVSFLITSAKKSWQSPKSWEMTIDLVLIISFISSPHQLHNQGFSMHGIWWSGWVAKQLASLVFVITQPPAVSSSSLFCSE